MREDGRLGLESAGRGGESRRKLSEVYKVKSTGPHGRLGIGMETVSRMTSLYDWLECGTISREKGHKEHWALCGIS